jgi:hypothetical protein
MVVSKVIDRWKKDTDDDFIDSYALCRKALANLIKDYSAEFKEFKNSDDLALRQSYYRRFSPTKKEEIRELFEKDKEKFLDDVLNNENLFRNITIRAELERCCWDHKEPMGDLLYPNIFNSRAEWFDEINNGTSSKISGDVAESPINRTDEQLNYIGKQINAISEKLARSTEEEESFSGKILKEIRDKLNSTTGHHKTSHNYGWAWAIAGFFIGYLVGR